MRMDSMRHQRGIYSERRMSERKSEGRRVGWWEGCVVGRWLRREMILPIQMIYIGLIHCSIHVDHIYHAFPYCLLFPEVCLECTEGGHVKKNPDAFVSGFVARVDALIPTESFITTDKRNRVSRIR